MSVAAPLQSKPFKYVTPTTGKAGSNPVQMNRVPLQLKTRAQNPLQLKQPASNPIQLQTAKSQVVQRVEREATVVWEITHLVEEQEDSLFGGADALANELPVNKGGQLTKGQKLLLDDEPVMLSRRGANQENAGKRAADKKGSHSHQWIRVLGIINGDGGKIDLSKQNVYVRKETITFTSVAPDKGRPAPKDIEVVEVENWEEEEMDAALQQINDEWIALGKKKRRRSVGLEKRNKKEMEKNELCSCPVWDQFDEGPDVASDMMNEEDRQPYGVTKKLWIYKAVYKGEGEPIAVMIIETRADKLKAGEESDDEEIEGPQYLYVRWLVGHPAKGGGGSELIKKAKALLEKEKLKTIKLESAHSAAEWYSDKGKDFTDKGPADHNFTGKGCGCREMEFTRKDT
ncbi:hypothetical protein [Niastella populi]|uniref:Uncharacterized protein n=1 Tax=Niastella populi TaxID=550983 RepID=A0A1V9GCK0_9BACT|nr:hypothetical protein [Niastella populi]OQP68267.1 hypothetical protein A4R26_00195 [Niastella populi]